MFRFGQSIVLAVCGVALLTTAGCRSGGDLVANPHLIIPAARFAASTNPPAPMVARELQKLPLPAVYVQPGDSLLLEPTTPSSVPLVTTDQVVAADGTIDLGVYGRVGVAGATVEEIEDRVREQICLLTPEVCDPPDDLPEDPIEAARLIELAARGPVSVRLLTPDSQVFYVLGEVSAPGAYPLDGRETVLDALLEAGGLTDRANRCEIILARPTGPYECRVVLQVCYDRLVQLGDASTNYQILPGDRLFVASKTFCESMSGIVCFWKKGCEHCCNTGSCPCPDASMASQPRRPFVMPTNGFHPPGFVPPAATLPAMLPAADLDDAADAGTADDSTNDVEADGPPDEETPDATRDADDTLPKQSTPVDLSEPDDAPNPSIPLPSGKPTVDLPRLD